MPRKRKPTVPSRKKLLKDGSVPEKVIQKEILCWLKETGLLHWRQNSGNVFAGNRRIKLGDSGLPDIVIIVPPGGRLLGMECKSARGRLRPDQVAFKERAEASGAYFCVVRSLKEAREAVARFIGEEQWKRLLASTSVTKPPKGSTS